MKGMAMGGDMAAPPSGRVKSAKLPMKLAGKLPMKPKAMKPMKPMKPKKLALMDDADLDDMMAREARTKQFEERHGDARL